MGLVSDQEDGRGEHRSWLDHNEAEGQPGAESQT